MFSYSNFSISWLYKKLFIFLFFILFVQDSEASQRYYTNDYDEYSVQKPNLKQNLDSTPSDIVNQYHYNFVPINQQRLNKLQLTEGNDFYRQNIGDQKQLGACSSFAIVDALLYIHEKTLSPAYLNVKAKSEYARDCRDNGLNIGVGMKCALNIGTVMDWVWPYSGYYASVEQANVNISNTPQTNWDVCIQSPYTPYQDPGLVKVSFENVQKVFIQNDLNKSILLRNTLATHKVPVVLSVPVQWNQEWSRGYPTTGTIRSSLTKYDGWHAVSVCGFDDQKKEFTFKNSWNQWGNGGFGTINYDYIDTYASEAWVGFGKKLSS